MHLCNRRDFVKSSAVGLTMLAGTKLGWPSPPNARVSLVHVGPKGRDAAIQQAIDLVGVPPIKGKSVALKPNFNSAHTFPGSTHPDTLSTLVRMLNELGAKSVVVADRSGMGDSRKIMEQKGIFEMAKSLRFEAMPGFAGGWMELRATSGFTLEQRLLSCTGFSESRHNRPDMLFENSSFRRPFHNVA